jgi:hypothetical protein
MWAVLYDDGTSLTTVSEPIAQSLAEAERQRGHQVTVRRVDDDGLDDEVASAPKPEPIRPAGRVARPEPVSEPGPALEPEPAPAAEPAQRAERAPAGVPASMPGPAREAARPVPIRELEPARTARPAGRRRPLFYVLAAASIVVAAALADHWNALPAVGAATSSSSTQVSGPPHRPQLLPPLDPPPVMHFSNAVSATSTLRSRSATGASSRGRPSATARGG